MIRICKVCGKEFRPLPQQVKIGTGVYCSKKCYGVSISGRNNRNWVEKKSVKCLICEKEIIVTPNIIKKGFGKLCSMRCVGLWHKSTGDIRGKNSPLWKGGEIKKKCEICGKDITVKASRVAKGSGRFCSYKCLGIHYEKKNLGSGNPRWQGGITRERIRMRGIGYHKWKREVLKINILQCAKCGSTNKKLNIHHPIPVSVDKSKRLDPKNAIILCVDCHRFEHRSRKRRIKMVRITLSHINMHGPLQFPAKKVQIFVEDHNLPRENLTAFYQKLVDNWLKANPDRQQFGDYEKDIVSASAMPNGSKTYVPSDDALGKVKPAVTEEEI